MIQSPTVPVLPHYPANTGGQPASTTVVAGIRSLSRRQPENSHHKDKFFTLFQQLGFEDNKIQALYDVNYETVIKLIDDHRYDDELTRLSRDTTPQNKHDAIRYLIKSHAEIKGAPPLQLQSWDLSGIALFYDRDFFTIINVDFSHANLSGAQMPGICFKNSLFQETNLQGAKLDSSTFRDCDLTKCNFTSATFNTGVFARSLFRDPALASNKEDPLNFVGIVGRSDSCFPALFQGCCLNGATFRQNDGIILIDSCRVERAFDDAWQDIYHEKCLFAIHGSSIGYTLYGKLTDSDPPNDVLPIINGGNVRNCVITDATPDQVRAVIRQPCEVQWFTADSPLFLFAPHTILSVTSSEPEETRLLDHIKQKSCRAWLKEMTEGDTISTSRLDDYCRHTLSALPDHEKSQVITALALTLINLPSDPSLIHAHDTQNMNRSENLAVMAATYVLETTHVLGTLLMSGTTPDDASDLFLRINRPLKDRIIKVLMDAFESQEPSVSLATLLPLICIESTDTDVEKSMKKHIVSVLNVYSLGGHHMDRPIDASLLRSLFYDISPAFEPDGSVRGNQRALRDYLYLMSAPPFDDASPRPIVAEVLEKAVEEQAGVEPITHVPWLESLGLLVQTSTKNTFALSGLRRWIQTHATDPTTRGVLSVHDDMLVSPMWDNRLKPDVTMMLLIDIAKKAIENRAIDNQLLKELIDPHTLTRAQRDLFVVLTEI